MLRLSVIMMIASLGAGLQGCGCWRDACPVSTEELDARLSGYGQPSPGVHAFDDAGVEILEFDPTAGMVIGEIGTPLDDLASDAKELTEDMRSIVENIEASSSQLLAEMDATFGERLDDTLKDMDNKERQLFADAQATVVALRFRREGVLDLAARSPLLADSVAKAGEGSERAVLGALILIRSRLRRTFPAMPTRVAPIRKAPPIKRGDLRAKHRGMLRRLSRTPITEGRTAGTISHYLACTPNYWI